MSKIYVKIKNEKSRNEENSKKWVIYELEEATEYGSSNYSQIKLGYEEEKNLERFSAGKELTIGINDDKSSVEGTMIVIPQNHWEAQKTIKQDVSDYSNRGVGKLGEWLENDRLKRGASEGKYWWALPVAIVVGLLIFGLLVYWAIKGLNKSKGKD